MSVIEDGSKLEAIHIGIETDEMSIVASLIEAVLAKGGQVVGAGGVANGLVALGWISGTASPKGPFPKTLRLAGGASNFKVEKHSALPTHRIAVKSKSGLAAFCEISTLLDALGVRIRAYWIEELPEAAVDPTVSIVLHVMVPKTIKSIDLRAMLQLAVDGEVNLEAYEPARGRYSLKGRVH